MAQAAQKHPHPVVPAPASAPDRFGAVAAGGPIADLQRTLEQRLLAADRLIAPAEEIGIAHRLSRAAGPVLLIAAYGTVALWWL